MAGYDQPPYIGKLNCLENASIWLAASREIKWCERSSINAIRCLPNCGWHMAASECTEVIAFMCKFCLYFPLYPRLQSYRCSRCYICFTFIHLFWKPANATEFEQTRYPCCTIYIVGLVGVYLHARCAHTILHARCAHIILYVRCAHNYVIPNLCQSQDVAFHNDVFLKQMDLSIHRVVHTCTSHQVQELALRIPWWRVVGLDDHMLIGLNIVVGIERCSVAAWVCFKKPLER